MPTRSPLIKVLLLFMAGIILPTGFLVYLGIQSIRSESLLLKRETQERVGKTARAIQDQAQDVLTRSLLPFSNLVKAAAKAPPAEAHRVLDEFARANRHSVSSLILLDAGDHLVYPIQEKRRQPAATLRPLPLNQQERLQKAESLEFTDHNYAAALAAYRTLGKETASPRWRAILLTSVAGCLMKQHAFDAAETQYHEILSRHAQEADAQGYPFGLVITSQLGELQQARGRADLAAASYFHVFDDLLAGRWDLSWDELEFFKRHVTERLRAMEGQLTPADRNRAAALSERWDALRLSAGVGQNFASTRWLPMRRWLLTHGRSRSGMLFFDGLTLKSGVIYEPAIEPVTGNQNFTLLATIDTTPMLSLLTGQLRQLAEAGGLAYRLTTSHDQLIAHSMQEPDGRRSIQAQLDQTEPPLQLSVSPTSDVPLERAAARRRQVYVGMVILAAFVILIALYATWYAVSREMEVAQLKARFVASISHELKTPLSIIGFISQKLELGRYETKEEVQDYYTMMSQETTRLKSLIDDVLDFSRLMENRQPYHKEPTDLVALLKETTDRFRHSLKVENVQIESHYELESCIVSVDREAISRAVLNLLDNAIKYSPPDRRHIALSLKQSDHTAVIQVHDEGYGIPGEEKDLVFDRFYRGRSASQHQKTNGAGLGLSIVQHIVTAHQGRVELQSTVGKGSIFTILIPPNNSNA